VPRPSLGHHMQGKRLRAPDGFSLSRAKGKGPVSAMTSMFRRPSVFWAMGRPSAASKALVLEARHVVPADKDYVVPNPGGEGALHAFPGRSHVCQGL
jgi:hypothetical protein